MSFLFASSHLPETRVQRPEDEEEEDDVLPMLHSGGVRAFSHLPAKRQAGDPAGPPSQRGAQALARQPQNTGAVSQGTPHEGGIAAAKASGVFDVVRQQYNRGDSPHFMDENGNLRPRQESRLPGSPSLRNPPAASADTSSWHTPPITPEDLQRQRHDDDATGSHSAPKGRPELNDLVYRPQGASPPKPEFNDLVYRFNGSPEEASDHRRDYLQNVAAAADGRGHLAQQTNTYGAAPDSRGNAGYASNLGSGSQPDATAPSTYKPYRSIYQDVMDGHKKYEAEAEPTVEMLEQKEKALGAQAEGARQALHNQLEIIKKRRELRIAVELAKQGYDKGKEGLPKGMEMPFDYGMDKLGLSPEKVIEKIDADIAKRQNELLKYWEEVEKANMALQQAKMETEAARKKELEKKQKQPPAKQTWTSPVAA